MPFASECEGDICFFYDREKPEQPPVIVKDWYDFNSAEIIADNLQNFIFYGLLQLVHIIYPNTPILLGDFYENIANIYRTHRPYLTEEQAKVLEEIYKREIKEYTKKLTSGSCYTFLTLLHEGEEETLLNKYNPLPKETILLKTL